MKLLLSAVALQLTIAFAAQAAPAFSTIYSIPSSGDGCGNIVSTIVPPSQLVPYNGALYGTTPDCGAHGYGTIFRYDPSTGTETVLYSFQGKTDGGQPFAALTLVGNLFYGTTASGPIGKDGGTVFKFDPSTNTETVLHQFGASGTTDGIAPYAPLLAFNGLLYGTTSGGGSGFNGTVFSVDPASGAEQILYAFQGDYDGGMPIAGLVALNGLLYGTTSSTKNYESLVFSIDPVTGTETLLHVFQGGTDGSLATSALTVINNQLYGMALGDDVAHGAVIYEVNPASGVETVLYSFPNYQESSAGLLASGNLLLGTTDSPGTVFSFDPAGTTPTTLYTFPSAVGGNMPEATLASFGGLLYGTSMSSALNPTSAIFTLDLSSGAETTAYNFTGAFTPTFLGNSVGVANVGGKLGVTAALGGSLGQGSILSVNPSTHASQQLASFLTRSIPNTPVVQFAGATYGTTQVGGDYGQGTVFKIDAAGTITSLHSFGNGSDGAKPLTGLTAFKGMIYGVTSQGGSSGAGTLFSINPSTGVETNLYQFSSATGHLPDTALVVVGELLYGTSSYGGNSGLGTVFSFDPVANVVASVYQFGKGDAHYPSTPVVELSGAIYGGASGGSVPKATGAIYKVDLSTGVETVLYNFVGNGAKTGPTSLTALGSVLYGTIPGISLSPHKGTVFGFDLSSSTLTTLHTFNGGAAGDVPSSLITLGTALFGTTQIGGADSLGTVFKIKP